MRFGQGALVSLGRYKTYLATVLGVRGATMRTRPRSMMALPAAVVGLLIGATPSFSNVSGEDVHSKPERFVHILVTENLLEREFFYCNDDLKFFDDFASVNCRYTVAKFNTILNRVQMGSIGDEHRDLLRVLLNEIEIIILERREQK